ncbi:MAG: hypothetical protein AAFY38_15905 [Pseudomonadota bacterium]
MKWTVPGLICALALTACQDRDDGIAFDGQFFNARLSAERGARDQFEVTVKPFSASADGARAAGEYEAISHCIDLYGSSEIIWERGPDAEGGTLLVSNDTLTLRGACAPL